MKEWIKKGDIWEREGYGKYPIIGSEDSFWMKYDEGDRTVKSLIPRHSDSYETDEYVSLQAILLNPCNDCLSCSRSEPHNCLNGNFFFFRLSCAVTKNEYYLISRLREYKNLDEQDLAFLEAHPLNIFLFNQRFLGGSGRME